MLGINHYSSENTLITHPKARTTSYKRAISFCNLFNAAQSGKIKSWSSYRWLQKLGSLMMAIISGGRNFFVEVDICLCLWKLLRDVEGPSRRSGANFVASV